LSTAIADREFSYITPSNDFKQSYIHPSFTEWNWIYPDAWIVHARQHGQILRMHGPISPQCSKWVRDDSRNPGELVQMLSEYMTALCKRYAFCHEIRWMDVVNEVINAEKIPAGFPYPNRYYPGDWLGPRVGISDWENPWPQIGYDESTSLRVPLYVDKAFEISNKYAPRFKQIINQHGMFEEVVWNKMKLLIAYLRGTKNRRVDGVGWQAHINMGWEKIPGNLERLDAFIKWCHANNLEFHITEMNVWMKNKVDEDAQASTFTSVLRVLLNNRATGVVGLNFWNVRDADTPNPDWKGTLWDNEGRPRKAYFSIKKELVSALEQEAKLLR
jgi:endo-1,4-beta-xylanase